MLDNFASARGLVEPRLTEIDAEAPSLGHALPSLGKGDRFARTRAPGSSKRARHDFSKAETSFRLRWAPDVPSAANVAKSSDPR